MERLAEWTNDQPRPGFPPPRVAAVTVEYAPAEGMWVRVWSDRREELGRLLVPDPPEGPPFRIDQIGGRRFRKILLLPGIRIRSHDGTPVPGALEGEFIMIITPEGSPSWLQEVGGEGRVVPASSVAVLIP